MQIDKDNKLWVLCSGIEDQQNPFNSTPGALLSFDLGKDSLQYYLADSLFIQDTLIFSDPE
ncbi:MAG: L-dopachrome tautomerase-related protein [Owenweeksia sp.]|nr:L-dopachrome tautomerase-related protein [Owenweeksia sp.]